ncbi:MAG: hypothetical protein KatS3mg082_3156 [Nitrospiraceae bacterium]|nr:MAG: hypothetical protein KatS3mg082_3156 [Nitrospiraceae bacterium]
MLVEPIESRVMLSGNVSVRITDSQVQFIGDTAANSLTVTYSSADNQLAIAGTNGTTIDGRSSRTYAARDNIAMSLGAGDDLVTLQRLSGEFNVGVDLGEGNDAVYFKRAAILAADFFGGAGNDTLDITGSIFRKRLRISPGEQDDVTALRNVRARTGLEITDTAGKTVVAMQELSAAAPHGFRAATAKMR